MIRALSLLGAFVLLSGCKKEPLATPPKPADVVVVTNEEQHNEIYRRGTDLITPYMKLLDRNLKVTPDIREKVMMGIHDLDAVTAYNPRNWAAFWVKGKGYQVLGAHEDSNREFKASFDLQQHNPNVAREYAASCLELGYAGEAIRADRLSIELAPDDAGLQANLALALLIDGRHEEAKAAIARSLEMAPDDKISQAVGKAIDEVISGKRPQPKTMGDLEKGR